MNRALLPGTGRAFRHSVALTVGGLLAAGVLTAWIHSHRRTPIPTVAFVPQAAGRMLWELEHFGAMAAAEKLNCHLYWNAPTSEDDVAGQISLIDRVSRGEYQGLVIAPNHPLAPLVPLRRVIAKGLPVTIVSAAIDLPVSEKLGYIINDDDKMGQIAASEVAALMNGRGSLAFVGIVRSIPGVTARVRGAERFLADHFPDIHVQSRLAGGYNASSSEELTSDALIAHPGLRAILSFTAAATRGAHAALKRRPREKKVVLVGCEQDTDLMNYVESGEIAGILAENTYLMGYEAVEHVMASLEGKALPARSIIPPLLITRRNLATTEAVRFTNFPR